MNKLEPDLKFLRFWKYFNLEPGSSFALMSLIFQIKTKIRNKFEIWKMRVWY